MKRSILVPLLALLTACEPAPAPPLPAPSPTPSPSPSAAPEPLPDIVRVRIETSEGAIVVALDAKRAPITAANFARYAEEKRFDGTNFYRASPTKSAGGVALPGRGFVQGGIRRDARRALPPIAHEPASETGITHQAGTISMARAAPVGAMGDFFITTSAMPSMDGSGADGGFAAFGQVVQGMDVVKRILAAKTTPGTGRGAMRGQMLAEPVRIETVRQVE